MNQNKLQKARPALGWMERAFLFYRIALVLPVIAAVLIPLAFAVEDMWTADRIIKDVYSKIVAISTVLAGLMSAVAVIGAKMSGTQQKADSAWEWLKRVWLAWVIINGIGAFIAYVRPLFDRLATLE
ncbi:Uncharacterised protein [uncultured Butyricicoccus sp.]|nr:MULTISPECIES: hypothetical protein [Agathobaculum]MCU6790457.1 hypothetical protein [Agathobaculum ammoniilyticum]SCJ62966.1 Uncharacterised protein [uncultured Butyricicoccus sp.]